MTQEDLLCDTCRGGCAFMQLEPIELTATGLTDPGTSYHIATPEIKFVPMFSGNTA